MKKKTSNTKKVAASKDKGKRYTEEQKAEVLALVDEVNARYGRGGIAEARRVYGISPLTLSNWVKRRGGSAGTDSKAQALRRMADIRDQIGKHRNMITDLEQEFERLKTEL